MINVGKLYPYIIFINLVKNIAILNFKYIEESHFPEIQIILMFIRRQYILALNQAKPSKKPGSKYDSLNCVVCDNRFLMYESKDKKRILKNHYITIFRVHSLPHYRHLIKVSRLHTHKCPFRELYKLWSFTETHKGNTRA